MGNFQGLDKSLSCCYSAQARGDDLCDPERQDGRCRKNVRVDERETACVIFLTDIQHSDGGRYHVVFPGRTTSNKWILINVKDGSRLNIPIAGWTTDIEGWISSNKTIVILLTVHAVIFVITQLVTIRVCCYCCNRQRRITRRMETVEAKLDSIEIGLGPRVPREYHKSNSEAHINIGSSTLSAV